MRTASIFDLERPQAGGNGLFHNRWKREARQFFERRPFAAKTIRAARDGSSENAQVKVEMGECMLHGMRFDPIEFNGVEACLRYGESARPPHSVSLP